MRFSNSSPTRLTKITSVRLPRHPPTPSPHTNHKHHHNDLPTEHKSSLPRLSPNQITKLRHLSLLSFAMQRRILPYSDLLSALEISNIRELEDLIIDAIYLDILRGKLDQKEQQFEVEYTMGRDIEPQSLGNLLGALQDWCVFFLLQFCTSRASSHVVDFWLAHC